MQSENPLSYVLRNMTPDDLPQVMAIEKRAFRYPWSAQMLEREMEHAWSTLLVAESQEVSGVRLLGFIIYWLIHDEVHILNIATDPSVQRRGIARSLLSECIARTRTRNAGLATLEVRQSNNAARALYESFGFREIGIRTRYYSEGENGEEDAVVMLLRLDQNH